MVRRVIEKMSRRGENIRKRKDGRWEGRYYLFEPNSGKKLASVDPAQIPCRISGSVGRDTTQILKELGYSDEGITAMYRAGEVR